MTKYSKEYYISNKEHIDSRNKEWTEKHKIYYVNYHLRKRLKALEILGNKCVICGFDDVRALEIDHIEGGGNAERKSGMHSTKLHNTIIKSPVESKKKYQLLCANHNRIKKYENGETRKSWVTG